MNKIPCEYSKKSPHLLPAGFSGVPARSFWKTKRSRKRILAKRNKYAKLSAVYTADSFFGGRDRIIRLIVAMTAAAAGTVQTVTGLGAAVVLMLVLPHLFGVVTASALSMSICIALTASLAWNSAAKRTFDLSHCRSPFFTVRHRDDQSDKVTGSAVDRSRLRRVSAGAFHLLSVQYRRS